MKTKINKLIQTLTAIALLGILAGCNPSTGSGAARTGQEIAGTAQGAVETFTLSGTLSLDSSALPKDFITQKLSNQRTATSSFYFNDTNLSYFVKATNGKETIDGTVSVSGNSVDYTIALDARGKWTITAFFFSGSTLLAAGQETITIDENTSNNTSASGAITLSFVKSFEIDSTKTGSISLAINNQSTNTASIIWHWLEDDLHDSSTLPADITKSVNGQNQSVNFTFASITSGAYQVEIIFKNSSEKILYSCRETINVFPEWTTDTWCGNSSYINDKNEFVFTDTIYADFPQDVNRLDIDDNTTLYYLWSNMESEVNSIDANAVIPQNQIGGQIFTSISANTTITAPIAEGSTFCFDGSTLYIPPYRYKNSYTGYVRDDSFNTNVVLMKEMGSSANYIYPSNTSCVYLDGYLYFIFGMSYGWSPEYYLACYDLENETVYITDPSNPFFDSYNYDCTSFAVSHNKDENGKVTGGVLYYSTESQRGKLEVSNPAVLSRKPFSFEVEEDSYGPYHVIKFTDPYDINAGEMEPSDYDLHTFAQELGFPIQDYRRELRINDMTIIDNTLYVLVSFSLFNDNLGTTYYTQNGNNELVPYCDTYICTGGIMKFDTSSASYAADDFVPSAWSKYNESPATENMILGFYALDPDYYYEKTGSLIFDPDNTQNLKHVFAVQPDDFIEDFYFFGPQKILAKKTNELIIVDDGGFIVAAGEGSTRDEDTSKPKNRVVTVNLKNESISRCVEVGTTFSSRYVPGTGSYCFTTD